MKCSICPSRRDTIITVSFSFLCTLQGHIPPFGFPSERVLRSECLLPNVQCLLEEWLRLDILALMRVEIGKTIERMSRIRMLRSECYLSDLPCSLQEQLRFPVFTLLFVENGKIAERKG